MSNLYVRLRTGFYTHRKTLRLRLLLGDDAYWLPPRLWAYAAENESDGDFSQYSPEELAAALGYSKDASSMLQALKQAGFLDETNRIHDWQEHNSFHAVFAERAKKAAKARWKSDEKDSPPQTPPKTEEKEIEKEIEQASPKHCLSMLQASTPEFSALSRLSMAKDLIDHLNKCANRRFTYSKYPVNAAIHVLRETGDDVEGLKKMIERTCLSWAGTELEEHLKPSTLFRKTKWRERYEMRDVSVTKNGKHSTPPYEKLKVIEKLIASHAANSQYGGCCGSPSVEQKNDFRSLIDQKKSLLEQIAKSQ